MSHFNFPLVIVTSLITTAGLAQEAPTLCPDPDPQAAICAPVGQSPGRIAFVDPDSGEVLTGEAAAAAALEEERSAFTEAMSAQVRESFSAEGLEEQRTETGAVAVDLQGRFQNPLVATIDPENGISIRHFSPGPVLD